MSSENDAAADDKPPAVPHEPGTRPLRPSRSGEGMDSVLQHLREQLRRQTVERLPDQDPEAAA